ncbi:Zinc finger MYM-type protein 1 [Linum perenne]
MAIVLRFVDMKGLIQERLFDVVHVKDTTSMTLYSSICLTLSSYKFAIQNIRGQGYDGVSNMRGEWNGLKALFLKDHPQAYYVHCMAHRLQLALMAAAKEVNSVHEFFLNLSLIVNAVTGSCKRHDEFKAAQANEIANKLALDELESGTGSNQEVLGITDTLCEALQLKTQDIVKAMSLVTSTIKLLNKLRDQDWDSFFKNVSEFCKTHDIEVPNLSAPHVEGRCTRQQNVVTNDHYYHFDVFNTIIDYQIEEIRSGFDEKVIELLKLSSCSNPSDGYKAFDVDAICDLAKNYYPLDFSEQEIEVLDFQLRLFQVDVPNHPSLEKLSSLAELCCKLMETGKSNQFYLVDRLIRLVLTLPVSTATGERVFSAMKIVKTRLRNKRCDDFLADSLIIYVERDISESFSLDAVLSDFNVLNNVVCD